MLFAICSLSQTPDARFLDCAGSAFDSTLSVLERGVWLIGLVSKTCPVCLGTSQEVNLVNEHECINYQHFFKLSFVAVW